MSAHTVGAARAWAKLMHTNQSRIGGENYFEHLQRVSELVEGEDAKIVAWLHDIVEDTPLTLAHIEQAGFDPNIVMAIDAITRRDTETHKEYIARCAMNPLARYVKKADVIDNMFDDVTRVISRKKGKKTMLDRYMEALDVIAPGWNG